MIRAREIWDQISWILKWDGVIQRIGEGSYKAVFQSVGLFGVETLVLLGEAV